MASPRMRGGTKDILIRDVDDNAIADADNDFDDGRPFLSAPLKPRHSSRRGRTCAAVLCVAIVAIILCLLGLHKSLFEDVDAYACEEFHKTEDGLVLIGGEYISYSTATSPIDGYCADSNSSVEFVAAHWNANELELACNPKDADADADRRFNVNPFFPLTPPSSWEQAVAAQNTLRTWTKFAAAHSILFWFMTSNDSETSSPRILMSLTQFSSWIAPLNGTVIDNRFVLSVNPNWQMCRESISAAAKGAVENTNTSMDAKLTDFASGYSVDIEALSLCGGDDIDIHQLCNRRGEAFAADSLFPLRCVLLFNGHFEFDAFISANASIAILQMQMQTESIDAYDADNDSSACSADLAADAFLIPSPIIHLPFAVRDALRNVSCDESLEDLNSLVSAYLDIVDVDNTISTHRLNTADGADVNFTVSSLNMMRGTAWCEMAELIRSDAHAASADIIFVNEADVGMARSNNQHTVRRLAFELGLNYAWATEFIELTAGTRSEQETTQGKLDAYALHGNAILSRFPLSNISVVRFPGDYYHSYPGQYMTAKGYEKRLGSRMIMYASVQVNERTKPKLGCFHLQGGEPDLDWHVYGDPAVSLIASSVADLDESGQTPFVIGGAHFEDDTCDRLGFAKIEQNRHDYLCAKSYERTLFAAATALPRSVSDHPLISATLTIKNML